MSDFDAVAALAAQPAKELAGTLGERSRGELQAMFRAERDGANRKIVRRVLVAEIEARPIELSPESVERIAMEAHEFNALYCAALNDDSQVPWNQAPQWQRDSVIAGVKFHLDNPDAPPSAGHDSWLAAKDADGWVYGDEKDADKKQHPCMVPYDDLPQEQKFKDALFKQTVSALAPIMADLEAAREEAQPTRAAEKEPTGPLIEFDVVDHKKRKPEEVAKDIVDVAFASHGGTIEFVLDAKPGDFRVTGSRVVLTRAVELKRDKRKVAITHIAFRNKTKETLGLVRMMVPLEGGGGRSGLFCGGSLGFSL
jgi:hypothetical protein